MRSFGVVQGSQLAEYLAEASPDGLWKIGVEEQGGRYLVVARPHRETEPAIVIRRLKDQRTAERSAIARIALFGGTYGGSYGG